MGGGRSADRARAVPFLADLLFCQQFLQNISLSRWHPLHRLHTSGSVLSPITVNNRDFALFLPPFRLCLMLTARSITRSALLSLNHLVFSLVYFTRFPSVPTFYLSPFLSLSQKKPDKVRKCDIPTPFLCLSPSFACHIHTRMTRRSFSSHTGSSKDDKASLSLLLPKSHQSTHNICCPIISFSWPGLELTGKQCQAKPSHNKPAVALGETRD